MQTTDDAAFQADVIDASQHRLVLACFMTIWSGPSKAAMANLATLEPAYTDMVTFVTIDVDESDTAAQKYGVNDVPTFVLFDKGQVKDTWSGSDIEQIQKKLDQYAPK